MLTTSASGEQEKSLAGEVSSTTASTTWKRPGKSQEIRRLMLVSITPSRIPIPVIRIWQQRSHVFDLDPILGLDDNLDIWMIVQQHLSTLAAWIEDASLFVPNSNDMRQMFHACCRGNCEYNL